MKVGKPVGKNRDQTTTVCILSHFSGAGFATDVTYLI